MALAEAFSYENQVVVEQFITGREFSVAVVDGKAYPVIEIAPLQGFYDYKNKYSAGSCVETFPAELSASLTKEMQMYAEKGYEALNLQAYARLDFLMKKTEICIVGSQYPAGYDTYQPDSTGSKGHWNELSTALEKLIEVSLKKYQ